MGRVSTPPGTAHEITLSAQAICGVPGTLCPEPELHPCCMAGKEELITMQPVRYGGGDPMRMGCTVMSS